jgi:hypothetical protein
MKKLVLLFVFLFAMGTAVNANSNLPVDSSTEIEDFGCARDCVDLAVQVAFLLDLSVQEYLVVYETCYNQNCAPQIIGE